jgi:hypothetical protein
MMVHHDENWLRLHLPAFVGAFDGVVLVDEVDHAYDKSGHEVACAADPLPVHIGSYPFNNNWSEMYNHVIENAERLGYDAIVRLDPDEAIFGYDVEVIRELLETVSVLCFARYNFWGDRLHYTPGIYPDWQCRAWRLHKGIRLGGQHHEGVGWTEYGLFEGDPIADTPRQVLRVPSINIYHYGNVGKERMLERDLHYLQVAHEQAGLPIPRERPADRPFPTRHSILFHGLQPLDPYEVGIFAPFSEEAHDTKD